MTSFVTELAMPRITVNVVISTDSSVQSRSCIIRTKYHATSLNGRVVITISKLTALDVDASRPPIFFHGIADRQRNETMRICTSLTCLSALPLVYSRFAAALTAPLGLQESTFPHPFFICRLPVDRTGLSHVNAQV